MSTVLTNNDDVLYDVPADSTVYALDGNDVVIAFTGRATIYGGEGGDFIGTQGIAPSELYGDNGADTVHGGGSHDRLYGGSGNDLVVGGVFTYTEAAKGIISQHTILSGDDVLYGNDGTDSLWGLDGHDVLYGGDGDDTNTINFLVPGNPSGATWTIRGGLYGGLGDDYLDGGRGNDYLDGGFGKDTMLGGLGDDIFVVDDIGDIVSETANSGIDVVRTTLDRYILPLQVEGVELQGSANLVAYGRSTHDFIYGNSGNNILFGDAGNDLLDGGAGNDTFSGGAGDDLLRDTGGGNDQFVFTGAWGNDVVRGFQAGTGVGDTLYFEKSTFANIQALMAAWSDVNGNVVINAGNGNTVTIEGVTTAQLAGNDFVFG